MKYIAKRLMLIVIVAAHVTHNVSANHLPELVNIVCKERIRQELNALEGKTTKKQVFVDFTISPGIVEVDHQLLKTPIAQKFQQLASEGFNVTQPESVITRANRYFNQALQIPVIQDMLAFAQDNSRLSRHWTAFEKHMRTCILLDCERDLPDFLLRDTPTETIEEHAGKIQVCNVVPEITQEEHEAFVASQLAMAFSLRLMLEKNPELFRKKFSEFLPSTGSAQPNSGSCSSDRYTSIGSAQTASTFASSLDLTTPVAAQSSETECSNTQESQLNVPNAQGSSEGNPLVSAIDPEEFGLALWNAGVHSL